MHDLRFALRTFLRSPRFTLPALLVLALGIGATSAIFSVVHGVVLEPLPYFNPDRIVVIWESNASRNRLRNVIGPANFAAWRERSRSFASLGMVGPNRLNLMLDGQPQEIAGLSVSADVFTALGVQPALGRTYVAAEDQQGHDAVAVLSHEFWQTRLNGRGDVLGTTLSANGRPVTVVGIMPRGFTIMGEKAEFMTPYGWTLESLRNAPGRGASHAIARLRDGVSLEQAREEMTRIAAELEKEAPQRNAGWSVALVPAQEQTVEQIRPALLVLSGAVLLVLLLACLNVANLLLARGTVRQRELGLRTALGAGRWRLLRQMLTESLLLAIAGGVAGLGFAVAFHRGLLALVADRLPVPRLDQVTLDLPVVVFTMAVALGTGLVFGLVPAILATSRDAVRDGGRHGVGPRARRVLGAVVVAEVALSMVLLTGAGLLGRSLVRLQGIDPGFRAAGVLTARVQLPGTRYQNDASRAQFFARAIDRIAALPGVASAAGVTYLPLSGPGIGTGFYRLDRAVPAAGQMPTTELRPVTPSFFSTMGIPQLAGRDFSASDGSDAPRVAVINATLARRYFGGEDPLGKRLHVRIGPPAGLDVQVIGVVGDIKFSSLDSETRPAIFLPHPQLALGLMTFVVRTDLDPPSLVTGMRAAVRAIDPELPLADVKSMADVVETTLARPRALSVLLTAFALIALLLAGVGVYGVMAYSVSQRTREIGVRLALGATVGSVFRLVIGHALRLIAAGVLIGLFAAGALTHLLGTLLFETGPLDPLTFGTTAVILGLVASMAAYLPARRGMRIPPIQALRTE